MNKENNEIQKRNGGRISQYKISEKQKKNFANARKKNANEIIRIDAEAKAHGMTYGQYVGLKKMGEWKKHES